MLDLIQMLETDVCEGLSPVVTLVKSVLRIIQFGIPIILILLGTIDLGKAVISSDDKEVKASQSRLIKRCLYAVAIFFVALLVDLVMGLVGQSGVDSEAGTTSWSDCWKES